MGIFRRRNRLGPLLRLRMLKVGFDAGLSRDEVSAVIDGVDDEVIDFAKQASGITVPEFESQEDAQPIEGGETESHPQGAGGEIIKAILAWISSPEGQAFIRFVFSLFGFII